MKPSSGDTHPPFTGDHSWIVRDDRQGTLARELGDEIEVARRLSEWVEAVTDRHSFERWEREFAQWRALCGRVLQRSFQPEAAGEFFRGTLMQEAPAQQWPHRRREAAKLVEQSIQLLVGLRATVARRGEPGRRITTSG